jgi:hypothetical protein
MKSIILFFAAFLLFFSMLTGCKQSEEPQKASQDVNLPGVQEVDKAKPQAHQEASQDMAVHSPKKPIREYEIIVPEDVKTKWESVVLIFQDKQQAKSEEITVKIGEKVSLAGSDLKVVVGYFLPDFKLDFEKGVLTSTSGEPHNPAVGIQIFEGEKQVYPEAGKKWGWLYANFPQMHAFEHQRYGLTLKGAIPKQG